MSRMNQQTKLIFALEHVAHLYDLIEDNESEACLKDHLIWFESELERQLANEIHRKHTGSKLGTGIQEDNPKATIKETIGTIGRIQD